MRSTTNQHSYKLLSVSQNDKNSVETPSSPKLRSIRSQKYLSNGKLFNAANQNQEINLKFEELRILTQQKDSLMQDLHRLKEGACSALIQKEEIIDKLKNENMKQEYFDEQKQYLSKQLTNYVKKVKELLQERNQIVEKCEKERAFFFEELYNKQIFTERLSNEINCLNRQIQELNCENRRLSYELLASSQSINKMSEQIQILKGELSLFYIRTGNTYSEKQLNIVTAEAAFVNPEKQIHQIEYKQSEEVEQLRKYYEGEIEDLTQFYEKQINIMRNFCQKQMDQNGVLKVTQETQGFSDHEENQTVYDLISLRSLFKPKLSDLKSQLKQMKDKDDESKSQFTSKYFQYEPQQKLYEKSTLLPTNIDRIEKQIDEPDNKNSNNKELIYGFGGGIIGAVLGISVFKFLCL